MTQSELLTEILQNGKEATFKKHGWLPYYGSWIKESWIATQPYDRMAVPDDYVIVYILNNYSKNVLFHDYNI